MGNNQTYKNRALATLDKKWTSAVVITLIYLVVAGGGSTIFGIPFGHLGRQGVNLLWIVLCFPLMWAYYVCFLRMAREESLDFGNLLDGYRNGEWKRIITTFLLTYIYVVLWSCLLIIPGIIKAISYAMVPFILKDNPELSNNAAIEKSMQMMEGHKMEFFMLELSFIGWGILCLFTFGIGLLLLIPYMYTAIAHYYEDLKAEAPSVHANEV